MLDTIKKNFKAKEKEVCKGTDSVRVFLFAASILVDVVFLGLLFIFEFIKDTEVFCRNKVLDLKKLKLWVKIQNFVTSTFVKKHKKRWFTFSLFGIFKFSEPQNLRFCHICSSSDHF